MNKYIKKVKIPVYIDNVKSNIYYYSTMDNKVQVLESSLKDVWKIIISYKVDLNIDSGKFISQRGALKEMLKKGELLYKLILKNKF